MAFGNAGGGYVLVIHREKAAVSGAMDPAPTPGPSPMLGGGEFRPWHRFLRKGGTDKDGMIVRG